MLWRSREDRPDRNLLYGPSSEYFESGFIQSSLGQQLSLPGSILQPESAERWSSGADRPDRSLLYSPSCWALRCGMDQ
jgi:hypothetical protein